MHRGRVLWHVRPLSVKASPHSVTESRVPALILVLGSQPADDVSHKPGSRLPLLSTRPAVTLATLKRAATNFAAWWTEARWVWTVCLRLVPDSGCDLNPGPSAPESSMLTTRPPSHCHWTLLMQITNKWDNKTYQWLMTTENSRVQFSPWHHVSTNSESDSVSVHSQPPVRWHHLLCYILFAPDIINERKLTS